VCSGAHRSSPQDFPLRELRVLRGETRFSKDTIQVERLRITLEMDYLHRRQKLEVSVLDHPCVACLSG